ncbi:hypothetical protein [Paenibacillus sp. FSL F4-0097]|uniref:hypothetical protein n=1 Tax=Paenibacillus sp. FSL F4-0097 TaxID=2921369 RepID=UPI0031581009
MSMTPERIEEIEFWYRVAEKGQLIKYVHDLLAALEESQQQINEWQGEAKQWRDEFVSKNDELGEAQQTIARKQLHIEKLELRRESAQKAADGISKEKGLELFEARQTIARQREALENSKGSFETLALLTNTRDIKIVSHNAIVCLDKTLEEGEAQL